jgi:parvulin-like peptidyl-prolyl isomerase
LCARSYQRFEQAALQLLLTAAWVEQEARAMGVTVSDATVRGRLAALVGTSRGARARFARSLGRSGMSVGDVWWRLRIEMLLAVLRSRVLASAGTVSTGQELSYFRSHVSRFSRPASRDLRVVITSSRAGGQAALARLRGGASVSSVAARYQGHRSGPPGGVLRGVARGELDPGVGGPVFSANVGRWYGPAASQGAFYVFEVTAVHDAQQVSFSQARAVIRRTLIAQLQARAWGRFMASFQQAWRSRTVCAAGFWSPGCSNSTSASRMGA